MSMWRKNSWCVEIILFLVLIFIGFISTTDAQTIEPDYPDEVEINEEFTFSLKLINSSTNEIYDVKIEIIGNGERIAKIYNDGWKSTFYYVNEALKDKADFKLKVENYIGKADVTIKLRDSKEKIKTFSGYNINVVQGTENPAPEEPVQEEKPIETKEEKKTDKETVTNKTTKTETTKQEKVENETEIIKNQPIKLTSKIEKEQIYKSKNQIIKEYAIYGFVILCVLIIIVLLFRRNKYREEI